MSSNVLTSGCASASPGRSAIGSGSGSSLGEVGGALVCPLGGACWDVLSPGPAVGWPESWPHSSQAPTPMPASNNTASTTPMILPARPFSSSSSPNSGPCVTQSGSVGGAIGGNSSPPHTGASSCCGAPCQPGCCGGQPGRWKPPGGD